MDLRTLALALNAGRLAALEAGDAALAASLLAITKTLVRLATDADSVRDARARGEEFYALVADIREGRL